MSIPKGHRELPVPEDLLNLLQAPALHHQPARARVAEVVESEVLNLGLATGTLEGRPDTPPLPSPISLPEHEAFPLWPLER